MGGEGITIVGNYDKGVKEYGRRTGRDNRWYGPWRGVG